MDDVLATKEDLYLIEAILSCNRVFVANHEYEKYREYRISTGKEPGD